MKIHFEYSWILAKMSIDVIIDMEACESTY